MEDLKDIRTIALRNAREIAKQHEEEVIQAYQLVMRLTYVCQKEGILALESPVSFMPKEMLLLSDITEMVRMMTDGWDGQFISEMLTLRFMTNQYCGLEAFLYYLYARSLLLIQSGASPYQIERFFHFAIPGKAFLFNEQQKIQNEYNRKKLLELKANLSDTEKIRLAEIAGLLRTLTEQEWKRLVSSNGFYGFETILPFLDQETQNLTAAYMNPYRYQTIIHSPHATSEQKILQAAKDLEEMVTNLRKKDNRMCLLEGILRCSDEEIRSLIDGVEHKNLVIALKGAKEEIMECFFRNMTVREKYCLQEDMEYIGPVRLCDVEDAQRSVLQTAERNGLLRD